jgi:hypothetical protein
VLISVTAYDTVDGSEKSVVQDIDLDQEFNPHMDADAIRETLDIILCDDNDVVDINEEDLYSEAEKIYQVLNG